MKTSFPFSRDFAVTTVAHRATGMIERSAVFVVALILLLTAGCPVVQAATGLYSRDNLVAWCIVPFDAKKRGPEERAQMLERLHLHRLAYDWRAEHIPTFDAELEALKRHGIELTAFWFPGGLNDEARIILEVLERHKIKTQLWVSLGDPAPQTSAPAEKVKAGAATIRPIAEAAARIHCQVALYNHGGWFGEPENQIAILESLRLPNVGIVYNLHHGHDHLDRFPALLQAMKPYLLAVNLNGMVKDGDKTGKKILPLGQGDLDLSLLKAIRDTGWHGPIGILNHTDEDAEARLRDNLDGLDWLVAQIDGQPAGPPPRPRTWASAGKLRFRHHYLDRALPGDSWAQTALVDVDRDGRLDYITGKSRGEIRWYRQEAPDHWTLHPLGNDSPSDVGGAAFDVDGDGWVDFIAGGAWYRNTGRPRSEVFERLVFDPDLAAVHDLVIADVDGDKHPDLLTMSDKNNLRWYRISQDPRQPWERHDIGPSVHAGIGVGDLDGDGDLDVVRSNVWFENADGKGLRWVTHENIPFGNPNKPYPLATHCAVLDIDRDGDNDLVMTENEIKEGRIGWLENADGKGGTWKLHLLPAGDLIPRGAYHSLIVADFDNDGDPDVFSCEMEGIPGDRPPRWFIWENLDGRGQQFVERVILDGNLGGHLAVAADVDGDGDLDIVSKLWRPRQDNANNGLNHVDLLENLLVTRP